jgi:hypothetical protein
MAGLDLGWARDMMAGLVLLDECAILVDQEGTRDDELDPVTDLLVRPAGDAATLYLGPCAVKPESESRVKVYPVGPSEPEPPVQYGLKLPWDAPDVPEGSTVVITAVEHDATLLGRRYVTGSVLRRTLLVSRTVRITEIGWRPPAEAPA